MKVERSYSSARQRPNAPSPTVLLILSILSDEPSGGEEGEGKRGHILNNELFCAARRAAFDSLFKM